MGAKLGERERERERETKREREKERKRERESARACESESEREVERKGEGWSRKSFVAPALHGIPFLSSLPSRAPLDRHREGLERVLLV